MPELPEVETIRSALAKRVVGLFVKQVVLRTAKLRQWLPPLDDLLPNSQVCAVARRAKYLLITLDRGTLIIHFGMSGKLRLMPDYYAPTKHDHIDWILSNHTVLRFNDPRRFGDVVWSERDPLQHPCLAKLGPEPFSSTARATDYFHRAQHKRCAIKILLLDQYFIAGIGNIYASEILFKAGIHPAKIANSLSCLQWRLLLNSTCFILKQAIQSKGSTVRDFLSVEGQLGNFQHQHKVYGRTNQPCLRCKTPIQRLIQQGRSSFYCPHCQLLKVK